MQDLKNYVKTAKSEIKTFLTDRDELEVESYIVMLCRINHIDFDSDKLSIVLLGKDTYDEWELPSEIKVLNVYYDNKDINLGFFFETSACAKIGILNKKSDAKEITEEEEMEAFIKFPVVRLLIDLEE